MRCRSAWPSGPLPHPRQAPQADHLIYTHKHTHTHTHTHTYIYMSFVYVSTHTHTRASALSRRGCVGGLLVVVHPVGHATDGDAVSWLCLQPPQMSLHYLPPAVLASCCDTRLCLWRRTDAMGGHRTHNVLPQQMGVLADLTGSLGDHVAFLLFGVLSPKAGQCIANLVLQNTHPHPHTCGSIFSC